MTKSQKLLENWNVLKEKIINLKKISDNWLILKIEVENIITERFIKILPGLGQISLASSNEQIIETLNRVANSLEHYCNNDK